MDKVILITGASSGIGAGIARELAGAGAKVLLGARRTDRTAELADKIAATGGSALAMPLPGLYVRDGAKRPTGAANAAWMSGGAGDQRSSWINAA